MIIEKRVNSTTEGAQYASSITGLADGGYLVIWASYGPKPGIYSQRYDANNAKQGSEVHVNTTISGSNPAITTLNNGGYVITWSSIDQNGKIDIYALRFNANGIVSSPVK